MCIQCLDASAFGKEVYCMYCRFVPRNTWKGACVPLPVSAEWCLAAHRLCRAGSSLGKHEPCSYGKGLWRNVTVPQVVSITTVVFCSFQAPPFNFSFFFFFTLADVTVLQVSLSDSTFVIFSFLNVYH